MKDALNSRMRRGGGREGQRCKTTMKRVPGGNAAARTVVERFYVAMDYAVPVHELQALCKLLKAKAHPVGISVRIVSTIVGVQSLGPHNKHEIALSTRHYKTPAHALISELGGSFVPV